MTTTTERQELPPIDRAAKAQVPDLSEAKIAETITDFLAAHGWRCLITDPVADRARGKGFGELGMADRLYIRYQTAPRAQVMWIEFKRTVRGRATKATAAQIRWHAAERTRGALVVVLGEDCEATIEGFIAWYKAEMCG